MLRDPLVWLLFIALINTLMIKFIAVVLTGGGLRIRLTSPKLFLSVTLFCLGLTLSASAFYHVGRIPWKYSAFFFVTATFLVLSEVKKSPLQHAIRTLVYLIGIANVLVISLEMILMAFPEKYLVLVRTWLVDPDNVSLVYLKREVAGFLIWRPLGLMGNPHLSGFIFVGFLLMLSGQARRRTWLSNGILLFMLAGTFVGGSAQNVLMAIVGTCCYWLVFSKKRRGKRSMPSLYRKAGILLAALVILSVFTRWLLNVGHLSTSSEISMLSHYLQTSKVLQNSSISECVVFGCGLEQWQLERIFAEDFSVPWLAGKINQAVSDNGFIASLFSYGGFFAIVFITILLSSFRNRLKSPAAGVWFTLIMAYSVTFSHYPVLISGAGLAFALLQYDLIFSVKATVSDWSTA
jgi:hypothetical protein